MRLTKTALHMAIGVLIGIIFCLINWLINRNPGNQFNMSIFAIIAFFIGTIVFERAQESDGWIDPAFDVLFGNIGFILTLWVGGAL